MSNTVPSDLTGYLWTWTPGQTFGTETYNFVASSLSCVVTLYESHDSEVTKYEYNTDDCTLYQTHQSGQTQFLCVHPNGEGTSPYPKPWIYVFGDGTATVTLEGQTSAYTVTKLSVKFRSDSMNATTRGNVYNGFLQAGVWTEYAAEQFYYRHQSLRLIWAKNLLLGELELQQRSSCGDRVLIQTEFEDEADPTVFASDYEWYAILRRGGRKIAVCQVEPEDIDAENVMSVLIPGEMTRYPGKYQFQLAYKGSVSDVSGDQWRYTNTVPFVVKASA